MSGDTRWAAAVDHLGPGALALAPCLSAGWVFGALFGLTFAPWHHAVCLAPTVITAGAFEAWFRRYRGNPQHPPADWVIVAAVFSSCTAGALMVALAQGWSPP